MNQFETKDNMTLKDMQTVLNEKESIDMDTHYLMHNISRLEKIIEELRSDLVDMKQSQIELINKNFILNQYERRFNTTYDKVISAIVGKENLSKEVKKFVSFKINYYKKMKKCRIFDIFSDKTMDKKFNFFKDDFEP